MQKHIEGYLGSFKTEDRVEYDEMAGGRDREELGKALNDAGNDRLIYIHFYKRPVGFALFPGMPESAG